MIIEVECRSLACDIQRVRALSRIELYLTDEDFAIGSPANFVDTEYCEPIAVAAAEILTKSQF